MSGTGLHGPPRSAASPHRAARRDAGSVPERAGTARLLRPVLLLLALLLFGLALRHLGLADGSALGADALRRGVGGRLLFLLLGTLCCAAGLPRQAVCFAAGLAYGSLYGSALAAAATVAGCAAAYGWARLAAPAAARRRLSAAGTGGVLARLPALARRRPFVTVLTLRLLPVGSSLLLNLAAGLLRLPFGSFLLATLLGALPQTLVFVLLGGGVRIGQGWQAASAVILFLVSGLGGLWLLRRGGAERA